MVQEKVIYTSVLAGKKRKLEWQTFTYFGTLGNKTSNKIFTICCATQGAKVNTATFAGVFDDNPLLM